MSGNTDVLLFFLTGALSFGLVGARFFSVKSQPQRSFGLGLFSFALSFLVWGLVVATKANQLDTLIIVGVVPFVVGLFFLVTAATHDWLPKNRSLIYGIAAVYLVALFVLRTFTFPSTPHFSDRGLIYFGSHQLVTLMYVVAFAGAFMTALQVVSKEINDRMTGALTRILFNLVVLSGTILLVSLDDDLQYLNGYLMLAAFIALIVAFAPSSVKAKLK